MTHSLTLPFCVHILCFTCFRQLLSHSFTHLTIVTHSQSLFVVCLHTFLLLPSEFQQKTFLPAEVFSLRSKLYSIAANTSNQASHHQFNFKTFFTWHNEGTLSAAPCDQHFCIHRLDICLVSSPYGHFKRQAQTVQKTILHTPHDKVSARCTHLRSVRSLSLCAKVSP